MLLSERLAENVRACFTGIWIQSHEHMDLASDEEQTRRGVRVQGLSVARFCGFGALCW